MSRTAAAHHEAGHCALVFRHHHQGFKLTAPISISEDGGGVTSWQYPDSLVEKVKRETDIEEKLNLFRDVFLVAFAGGEAELRQTNDARAAQKGIEDDMMQVTSWLKCLGVSDLDRHRKFLEGIRKEAKEVVEELGAGISAIASKLLEGVLTPEDAWRTYHEAQGFSIYHVTNPMGAWGITKEQVMLIPVCNIQADRVANFHPCRSRAANQAIAGGVYLRFIWMGQDRRVEDVQIEPNILFRNLPHRYYLCDGTKDGLILTDVSVDRQLKAIDNPSKTNFWSRLCGKKSQLSPEELEKELREIIGSGISVRVKYRT